MTGKTKDGQTIYHDLKVLMPMASGFDRDNKMAFGAHRKTGYMVDTSLQPGIEKVKIYEFPFPYEDVEKEGKKVRNIKAKEVEVTVSLWFLPSDAAENLDKLEEGKKKFLFFSEKRLVKIN